MTPGWTPLAVEDSQDRVSPDTVVWCPVCGNAPANVEHDGFCSRACRAASLDYHNRQSIQADQEYERGGQYVHDKTFDVKGPRPGWGGRRRGWNGNRKRPREGSRSKPRQF